MGCSGGTAVVGAGTATPASAGAADGAGVAGGAGVGPTGGMGAFGAGCAAACTVKAVSTMSDWRLLTARTSQAVIGGAVRVEHAAISDVAVAHADVIAAVEAVAATIAIER